MNKLVKYIKNSFSEGKKISWPTKKEAKDYTIVVCIISIFIASFLGASDFVISKLIQSLI